MKTIVEINTRVGEFSSFEPLGIKTELSEPSPRRHFFPERSCCVGFITINDQSLLMKSHFLIKERDEGNGPFR